MGGGASGEIYRSSSVNNTKSTGAATRTSTTMNDRTTVRSDSTTNPVKSFYEGTYGMRPLLHNLSIKVLSHIFFLCKMGPFP